MTAPSERTAIYRLYDDGDHLLYVGITSDPKTRFASHATYKHWWAQVSRKEVSWMEGTWRQALAIEAAAIRDEQPKFNDKHNATLAPFPIATWQPIDAPPRGKAIALAELIRAEIQAGHWISGMRLPRRADVARATGVGESTADLAYKNLAKDGFLYIRHGQGTFVA
ncbi:GntR family transcriptional regulator [Streptomyces rochei]|uniref:GntR family transcriptional regulator n=1 Tax=Streptomyces rochei TaxID=1928 RepID=UPI0037D01EF4